MTRAWKALPVAALVLITFLDGVRPARAESADWGPGGTVNFADSPDYTLPIRIVDGMVFSIRQGDGRRQAWYSIRNEALAEWAASGVTFKIIGREYMPCLPYNLAGVETHLTRNAITIGRGCGDWGSATRDFGGWAGGPYDMGFAACGPSLRWWKPYFRYEPVSCITHEVGHALGFGHPDDNSPGTMGGGNHVSAIELQLLHDYYLGSTP